MTDLWQFSESHNDCFLTHLLLLIHFWGISKSFLTDLWLIFESDRFLTNIWHNSDRFLTDFWQTSDRFRKIWDLHCLRVPFFSMLKVVHSAPRRTPPLVSFIRRWDAKFKMGWQTHLRRLGMGTAQHKRRCLLRSRRTFIRTRGRFELATTPSFHSSLICSASWCTAKCEWISWGADPIRRAEKWVGLPDLSRNFFLS